MGRTPLPTAIKAVRGNPGQRPLGDGEPTPPPADPRPPRMLDGVALDKWNEMVGLLSSMGVFTQADRTTLERYCLMYDQWATLQQHFKENLRTQLTQTGYSQVTAEATLEKQLRSDMLAIERQFGMTPAARSTIKVSGAAQTQDPLTAFISSRGN